MPNAKYLAFSTPSTKKRVTSSVLNAKIFSIDEQYCVQIWNGNGKKKIGFILFLFFILSLSLSCFSQLTSPFFLSLSNLAILPPSCRSRHSRRWWWSLCVVMDYSRSLTMVVVVSCGFESLRWWWCWWVLMVVMVLMDFDGGGGGGGGDEFWVWWWWYGWVFGLMVVVVMGCGYDGDGGVIFVKMVVVWFMKVIGMQSYRKCHIF